MTMFSRLALLAGLLVSVILPVFGQNIGGTQKNAPQVVAQRAAAITNTALGTSELNMASIAIPPLAANDTIRITTLWSTAGTATDSKSILIRLGATGCTSLAACSTGTVVLSINLNSSSLVSGQVTTVVRNANATNAQVFQTVSSQTGFGFSAGATGTAAVETNAGSFINIDTTNTTSQTNTIQLVAYTIEIVRGV